MKQMSDLQETRDQQAQQLLNQQRHLALLLILPDVKVLTFSGDPIEYSYFLRSFENLIEAKTISDSARLFYLVQYTSGDVQDLIRSCLTMEPTEWYKEAKRLLKEKYGQNYKIAAAFVNRVNQVAAIRAEDGAGLQKFSVLLISCRNILREIGYINKVENPDCLVRMIEKLPFFLRQKWRDVANDITNNKAREVTFDDVVKFVEARARVMNHPIFGKLNPDNRSKHKDYTASKGTANFGIESKRIENANKGSSEIRSYKCVMCNGNHIFNSTNNQQQSFPVHQQSCNDQKQSRSTHQQIHNPNKSRFNFHQQRSNIREQKPNVAIVGDSMLKYINPSKLRKSTKCNIQVKTFPGAKVSDMKHYIKPTLSRTPDCLIMHIGTNDLKNSSPSEISSSISSFGQEIRKEVPNTNLVISEVIIRNDDPSLNVKISELNKNLAQVCANNNWDFITHKNILPVHLNSYGLHLNKQGSSYLAKNFINFLKSD